jgi:hypothetical protein
VWILEAALKNRQKQFIIDGEAVILGIDGIPDFNALHSRRQDDEVQLYAFDIMALDGEDLRQLPLSLRKTNLARLLACADPMASSSHPMSRARLVRTCFVACPVARRGTEAPRPTLPPKSPATTGRGSRLLSVRPKAGAVLIGTLSLNSSGEPDMIGYAHRMPLPVVSDEMAASVLPELGAV